jgi:hypothetical protein
MKKDYSSHLTNSYVALHNISMTTCRQCILLDITDLTEGSTCFCLSRFIPIFLEVNKGNRYGKDTRHGD